jgi:hypothetical protein
MSGPVVVTPGPARCSSCRRPIWYGLTINRKRMPMDPQPVEDGNVVMDWLEQVMDQLAGADEDGPGEALPHVRVLRKDEVVDPDVPRYVSHFVTCPSAQRHRKKRGD